MHQFNRLQFLFQTNAHPISLNCTEDMVFYLKSIWDAELINLQEQAYLVCLNNQNEVICWRCINTGCSDCLLVDIKLAAACAVGVMATKVVLAHNHPSGLLVPSNADLQLTRNLLKALNILDIELADHLIINARGYYSFRDNGQLSEA